MGLGRVETLEPTRLSRVGSRRRPGFELTFPQSPLSAGQRVFPWLEGWFDPLLVC
jgi:hypothetical protein